MGLAAMLLLAAAVMSLGAGYETGRSQRLLQQAASVQQTITVIAAAQSAIASFQMTDGRQRDLAADEPRYRFVRTSVGVESPSARPEAHITDATSRAQALIGLMNRTIAAERRVLSGQLATVKWSARRVAEIAILGAMLTLASSVAAAVLAAQSLYGRESVARRKRRARLQLD